MGGDTDGKPDARRLRFTLKLPSRGKVETATRYKASRRQIGLRKNSTAYGYHRGCADAHAHGYVPLRPALYNANQCASFSATTSSIRSRS